MKRGYLVALTIAVAGIGFGETAYAVDGVILSDQNKALAGAVTPGDAPGFPVTLTQSGSYRLASNLVVPDANTSAIVIGKGAIGVSIDLNGFSIIGPGTVGTGIGISSAPDDPSSPFGTFSNVGASVRNGTIFGMGSSGISLLAAGSAIENVTITKNGSFGIVANLCTLTRNRIMKNGAGGINASSCVVTQNMISQNTGAGIQANDSLIVDNALIVNAGVGLAAANDGFGRNVFSSNNGGFANPQFSGRTSLAPNTCDGAICP